MNTPSALGDLLHRPEAGAFLGLVAVLVIFAIFGGLTFLQPAGMASRMNVAANLGVIAIPVGLLMIAGEPDISVGTMVPFGAMTTAVISGNYGLPIWSGIAAALGFAVIVGLVNGYMVIRTAVLIRGAVAADFRKGERTREEITGLMAGVETMATLEAEIETYMTTHDGHPPSAGAYQVPECDRPIATLPSRGLWSSTPVPRDMQKAGPASPPARLTQPPKGKTMANWSHTCATGDIHPEDLIRFDHGSRTFCIYHSPDDTFHVTDGHCSHENVHLCDGLVMDPTVECPKHAGVFD